MKIPVEIIPQFGCYDNLKTNKVIPGARLLPSDMDVGGFPAEDELARQGLFIDDIDRLRILDPSVADQTQKLKTECDHFLQSKRNVNLETLSL